MLTALSPAGNNDHDSRAVPYKIFVQNLLGTYVFIRFTCLHQMFPWGTLLREHLLRCFCWSSGCRIRSTPAFNRSDTSIDTLRYYCVDADPFLYFSLRKQVCLLIENRTAHGWTRRRASGTNPASTLSSTGAFSTPRRSSVVTSIPPVSPRRDCAPPSPPQLQS